MLTDTQLRLMDQQNLSPAQKRTIELVMKGYENKLIAEKLHITEKAVRYQITRINEKLKTTNKPQLIVFFSQRGWFSKEAFTNNLPLGK